MLQGVWPETQYILAEWSEVACSSGMENLLTGAAERRFGQQGKGFAIRTCLVKAWIGSLLGRKQREDGKWELRLR